MSRRFSRIFSFIATAAAVLVVASVVPAVADDIYNTLDASIDASAETLNLNTGGAAQTVTFGVDQLNGDGKNGCNFQGAQIATFQVNVSAPARVTVSPSTLTFDSCSSNPTLTVTPGATAGSSTVSLTQLTNQTSGTFNVAPATFSAVVANNNVAPTVSAKAANATGNEGQTLSTSGAFADSNGVNTITSITKTSGAGTVTPTGSGGWGWSLPTTDNGSGSVVVTATDSGGLTATDTFTWAANNVAPTIVSDAGNVSGTEGIAMSNGGSFTDVSGDLPLTITQSAGPGTVTQGAGNTWSWSHTPADQTSDPVTVSVQVSDGDGGTTTDSFTFTAVNANPQIVIKAANITVNEGQTASTNGAFGDVAADPLTITRVPLIGTLTSATTGTWSWSLLTQDQTSAAITVNANDGDGGSQVDVFSYTVLNVAPSVSVSPANASGVEGTVLASGGAFTDPGAANDPLTITKTAGDGTVTDNGDGTWTWAYTPADEGSGSVTVSADDGDGGTKTTTFNWSATNLNPVVQNAAADATGNEGDTLSTSGRFRDVPGDALTITKLSGSGTVTDNHDGTWSWSLPTNDVENGTVVVQVTDGDGGSTTDSFDYSASDVQASVKNAADDAVGDEGGTLATHGSFKGAAVDTLVVEQVSGVGTLVDNGDGSWSWSLATTDDVSGSVTVRVSDDDGNISEDTFTYTANDVKPSVATNAGNINDVEGATLSNSGSFTGAAADTITLNSANPNVVITGHTWSWSLVTDDEVSGSVEVSATDDDGNTVTDSFDYVTSNVAPSVVVDAADQVGVEGQLMTTSGSFADVAGDVPLSISGDGPGTVTADADGTSWSWSFTPADQMLVGETVTVTADDGDGGITTDTFDVTAANADPTVTQHADDVTINEGQTGGTAGAFGDVVADPLVITHSPSSVGTLSPNSSGAWSWSIYGLDDAEGDITVTADDSDTGTASDTFHYTVKNVAPSVDGVVSDVTGAEGTELTNAGGFTDPGGASDPLTITGTGAGTVTDNEDGTWSWSYAPGDNGDGTITVTADDGDGGITTASFDWTATNTPPTVFSEADDVSLPEGSTLIASGSFDDVPSDVLTITSDAAGGELNISGRSWTWTHPTTGVESGSINVTATDDDGDSVTDTFNYEATNVVPTVETAAAPNPAVTTEGGTLHVTGSFTSAAVDTLEVTKSGAGTMVDNGDGSWSWSLVTTDDGSGSVTVTVKDDDGTTAEDTFDWEATDVEPTVFTAGGNASGVEGATLTASGSFDKAAVDTLTITSSGAGDLTLNPDGVSWSWSLVTDDEVSGSVEVSATDDDGNTVTDSFDYVTSNVAPSVVVDAADQVGVEGQLMTTSGSFADVAGDVPLSISGDGPGTVTADADGTSWSWSFTPADQMLVGETVTVTADDGDGGITTDTFDVTAANADPTVTQHADDVTINEGQTGGTAGAFGDVVADPLVITHSPSSVGTLSPNSSGAWSWSIYGLDDAEGDITVTADDSDTGTASDTFHYTVKNVAPSVDGVVSDVTGAEGTELTNAGGFTDPGGASDPLTITGTGAGTVTDNEDGTWSWSYAPGDNGDGTITVTADDGDGGITTASFDWTATNTPPTVQTPAHDATGPEGSTLMTEGAFTDVPADTITVSLEPGDAGTVTDLGGGSWKWALDTNDNVSGTVTVIATDDDGDFVTDTFDYASTNLAPTVVTDAADSSGDEGVQQTRSGSFSDVGGDLPLDSITKTTGPGTLSRSGDGDWSWSFTPNDELASTLVTIKATDKDGASVEDTFVVSATNVPPTVSQAAADVVTSEGQIGQTTGAFADVDTVSFTHAGKGSVSSTGSNGWAWSYQTTDDETGNVTVTADDGDGGQANDDFHFTVNNVNPSSNGSVSNPSGFEGSQLQTDGSFTDPGTDPLTITKDSGAGQVTDLGGGSWNWAYTPNDNGSGSVTVKATDDDGGAGYVTFSWTSSNVAPTLSALTMTGASGTACLSGNTVGLSFSVSDPSSADTMTGNVAWGDTSTSTFSGRTPSLSHSYAPGVYTVTVNVTDDDGGAATPRSASVSRTYVLSAFQPPINNDNSSVFKAGSTVPVKIKVTDCSGASVPNVAPTIATKLSSAGTPPLDINETIASTSAADTTGFMRYTEGQYIYNLNTKLMADPNATYWLEVRLGTVAQQVKIGLRSK